MVQTRFLTREQYWAEIAKRVPSAKRTFAAVAYLGAGGADYLPLKANDVLVIDLSLRAVRQGVTDPREIKKLVRRGVKVFSRDTLHAKLIVTDGVLISSSANVSRNAKHILDESAVLTTSPTSVSAATKFIRGLCIDAVREGYLKQCLGEYKPPRFKAAMTKRSRLQSRKDASLWYIGGLHYLDEDRDELRIEEIVAADSKKLRNPNKSEVVTIRFNRRPHWFDEIKPSAWIIDCVSNGRGFDIGPPCQLIQKRVINASNGKPRFVLSLEIPSNGECMNLTSFRRQWRSIAPSRKSLPRRTQPILDEELAISLRRLWTWSGKISRKR